MVKSHGLVEHHGLLRLLQQSSNNKSTSKTESAIWIEKENKKTEVLSINICY